MNIHQARTRYNTLWDLFCNSESPAEFITKEMFQLEQKWGYKNLTPTPKKERTYKSYVKPKFKKDTRNMKRYNHLDTNYDFGGWAEFTDEREEAEFEYFAERQ